MNARPILFSAPMVRALLEGRKTQTRRIVKPQPDGVRDGLPYQKSETAGEYGGIDGVIQWGCPYGQPGDLLWVRETFAELSPNDPETGQPFETGPGELMIDGKLIAYRANSDVVFCDGDGFSSPDFANKDDMPRWRPSIHMPRWASRLTLELTDVRVERVQDISIDNILAEGVRIPVGDDGRPLIRLTGNAPPAKYLPKGWSRGDYVEHDLLRAEFASLWDSLNEKRGYGWGENPWVWALTFKVHQINVDSFKEAA